MSGPPRSLRRTTGALVAAALLAAGACGTEPDAAGSAGQAGESAVSGEVVVLAAASLTETFTQISDDFEAEHDGVEVTLSFAGSSSLATQITGGAPADVFASANKSTMQTVVDAALAAGEPEIFVHNTLQIAVPAGNPGDVTELSDLADPGLAVALCADEVPCGSASAEVFDAAGLTPQPDTLEKDVKAALTKVELGEVDAALVYRTDVTAAGSAVEGIDFPEAADAVNDYPITALADAPNPAAAAAFVDYVRSDAAASILSGAGFRTS